MERRYLIVPGLRSSRIHILDTWPDPRNPKIVKVIEPETVMKRTGYSRPHTVPRGPEGIYFNTLGSPNGEGPVFRSRSGACRPLQQPLAWRWPPAPRCLPACCAGQWLSC